MRAIHARKLHDILDDYHVTIDENAPSEQECAVHPELLGNVFERLLAIQKDDGSGHAESARSGRGTYYTPPALTAHIVAETLSRAVNDGAKNEDLYDLLDPSTEAMPASRLRQVAARHPDVGERIRRLTVLDPACGSGGFLIAAAAAIEAALARLAAVGRSQTTTRTPSRYEILRDNVRGIDVDANAVNIARLRLYLHHLMDPGRRGRAGDSKLPRLDLVVQVGDGLAPLLTEPAVGEADRAGVRQPSFGDMLTTVPAAGDRYQRAAQAWFNPESDEDRTRRELENARKSLRDAVEAARDDHFGKEADATRRRMQELPDGEVGHTGGLDARVAFGETSGFDAIIGNPPYVALQQMGPEQQSPLRERFGDDYVGRGDVYMLFMAHVPKLLRENGIWSLLVSQTWLQNDAGRRTRDKLRPHVLELSTVGGGWFNDATVAVAAVTARSTPVEGGAEIAAYALDRDRPELPPRDGGAKRILYTARSDGWTLLTRTEETLIEKIRACGPTLADREDQGEIKIRRGSPPTTTTPGSSPPRRRGTSSPKSRSRRTCSGRSPGAGTAAGGRSRGTRRPATA